MKYAMVFMLSDVTACGASLRWLTFCRGTVIVKERSARKRDTNAHELFQPGKRSDMSKTAIDKPAIDGATATPAAAPAEPTAMAEMAGARPMPGVKTLRRALGLTQEDFAARYRIPVGTLRDWEQGRTEPDQPARAYIKVIASNPEWVSRALAGESP
jgi:putative transcriptional regulator